MKLLGWAVDQILDPIKWRRLNGTLVLFWTAMLPLAIIMGWVNVVVFISLLSIYANWATHLGVWAASRAEAKQIEIAKAQDVDVDKAQDVDVDKAQDVDISVT